MIGSKVLRMNFLQTNLISTIETIPMISRTYLKHTECRMLLLWILSENKSRMIIPHEPHAQIDDLRSHERNICKCIWNRNQLRITMDTLNFWLVRLSLCTLLKVSSVMQKLYKYISILFAYFPHKHIFILFLHIHNFHILQ